MSRLATGQRLGSYEVLGPLGAGGMGEVYRGRDLNLGREVAIKLLPEAAGSEALVRFRREAELLAALNHPNIATLYHLEEDGGVGAIVMELVDGVSLAERLREGPLPVDEALRLGAKVAAALEAAHAAGIVHRDLKPANVMLTMEGEPKVLDFGIARASDPTESDSAGDDPTALTAAGRVIGTAPYMSPEQVRAQSVDQRTDVWALGCLLFEMLTGTRAFGRETMGDTMAAVLEADPHWSALPGDLDAAAKGLLQRCLSKRAADRPASAKEVRAALEGERTIERPAAARSRSWWALGPTAVLILVLGLWWFGVWSVGGPNRGGSGSDFIASFDSVVVLPATVSADSEQAFLADAIPNAITTQLARSSELRTLSPPTQSEVVASGLAASDVAARYGAAAFVRPSVLAPGDDLVISMQLVDATTHAVVWVDEISGPQSDYVVLMRQAAARLLAHLRPGESLNRAKAIGGRSPEQQLIWERGRFHMRRFVALKEETDFTSATAAFTQLLTAAPTDPGPPASMALLQVTRAEKGDVGAVNEIDAWARRALELDPSNAEALAALFNAYRFAPRPDYDAMVSSILKAASSRGPDDSSIVLNGVVLAAGYCCGRLVEAAGAEATRVHPLAEWPLFNVGAHTFPLDPEVAGVALDELLKLQPAMPGAHVLSGITNAARGRLAEATGERDWLVARVESGVVQPFEVMVVDHALALARGDNEAANGIFETLYQQIVVGAAVPFHYRFWSAYPAFAALRAGQVDEFLRIVDTLDAFDTAMFFDVFLAAPASAYDDPHFVAAYERARKHALRILDMFEAARAREELPAYLEPAIASERARLVGAARH